MKRIIALIAALLTAAAIFPLPKTAKAQSLLFYARAQTRAAYFYSSQSLSSALFAIPYTYCVEVLSEEGEWYYVKYADDYGYYRALYGYCLKTTLTPLSAQPETVYLYKEIKITYTSSSQQTTLPTLSELTVTAAFYGTFYSGPTAYSYVLCQGSFGYIEGANDDYDLLDYDDGSGDTEDVAEQTSGGANGKIIAAAALAFIAAASVILLIATGKKRNLTG